MSRPAVIFNPTARGEKARALRERLAALGSDVRLLPTEGPGHATLLAADAVRAGCDLVVAAGGDGTVNEVVNGMASDPALLAACRLAVLPLGTVNVFAKELGVPEGLDAAWTVALGGGERVTDLAHADLEGGRRWFVQLAGAGLDSQAIGRVRWAWKRRWGPLAYIWAGWTALHGHLPRVTVTGGGVSASGQMMLVGNGRFYGGRFTVFPAATVDDGLLDVALMDRVNVLTVIRGGVALVRGRFQDARGVRHWQAGGLDVSSDGPLALQVEGDNVGLLPARIGVVPGVLRVRVPRPRH